MSDTEARRARLEGHASLPQSHEALAAATELVAAGQDDTARDQLRFAIDLACHEAGLDEVVVL